MVDIDLIVEYILKYVYENEDGDITGQGMQDVLVKMVTDLGMPVNNLDELVDALRRDLTGLQESSDLKIKENTEKITKLQSALDALKQVVDTKADRVELAETDAQVLANSEAIEALSGKVGNLEMGGKEQDKAIAKNAQDITDNKKAIAENLRKIGENATAIGIINGKIGNANGIASLDQNGRIPAGQMPDGVYEIVRGTLNSPVLFTDNKGKEWKAGEKGIEDKLFIDSATRKFYSFDGINFKPMFTGVEIGETEGTAYDGLKGKQNAEAIKQLQKDVKESQIRDLSVEIRNVGGNQYIASESASEIASYAQRGGNVKIVWKDRLYFFTNYAQSTAYFQNVDVEEERAIKRSIAVQYNKSAILTDVVYEQTFDATELLTASTQAILISAEFEKALDDAIRKNRTLYVKGNGGVYLLNSNVLESGYRKFTGISGRTNYVLSLRDRAVSLDTYQIGADIHIFNNREGVNILNLTIESSNEEIKDVFTESFGEVVIPNTGDIFNIFQNSDMANSGVVGSMVEDSAEIRLVVNMSNFEDNLIHRRFFKFSYDPARGVDSLRITNVVDNIINPSLLTEQKMDELNADIASIKNKNKKQDTAIAKIGNEVNEYNISKLTQSAYDLQGAISALNAYLGGGSRTFGMKVTFIDDVELMPKTFKFVKGTFTAISSWQEVVPYRIINQLICGMDRFGHARGLSVDVEDVYKVCGHPLVVYGEGTPSASTIPSQNGIPAFIGQVYIDTTASSGGAYYAKGTSSVSDWVKF